MLRIASPLSADLEDLIEKILGCCVAVHRELGPGLLESIYARAVRMELEARDIRVEAEKVIPCTIEIGCCAISVSICSSTVGLCSRSSLWTPCTRSIWHRC